MPTLRVTVSDQQSVVHHIYKKVTSIGCSDECDVVVKDARVAGTHCHIHFDGQVFHLAPTERENKVFVNGKRRKKHDLSHQDEVAIGDASLMFSLYDEPVDPGEASRTAVDISPYRMLFDFSSKLLTHYELPRLLEALMDAVISVTNADKGFLILFDDNQPAVRVARNLRHENIDDAVGLSDSIVAKVLATKRPLMVSDALKHDEFANSKSIMNLKVVSVMCVPLMDKDTVIGLIYVGNDNVVELFEEQTLEVLTILAAQASLIIKNALLIDDLRVGQKRLSDRLEAMRFGRIIGACDAMLEVFKKVEKVATTDISVLITGETGTGKELIAKEVHERSSRSKGPFVTINCGAIPENLLESELFGHVKGAFTGADADREGLVRQAGGGTLFLDEVGELPLPTQAKLLRVLQEKTVMRVGGTKPETVDIRIFAATNRDLDKGISENTFREDLYYRLNVVNVHLPPLRDREDDVLVIAKYFLNKYAEEFSVQRQRLFTECRDRPAEVPLARQYPSTGKPHQKGRRAGG
jgi:transcriptional regulator with GAF, ATPase, and Fis domain